MESGQLGSQWPLGETDNTVEPRQHNLSFSILHTQGCHSYDLPEATGRLESAALSAPTASVTRDGYTHTAAVVTPDIRDQSKEEETW